MRPSPRQPPRKRPFPWILLAVSAFSLWLVWRSVTPALPEVGGPPRLYVHPSHQDLRQTLLGAIQAAITSLNVVVFGLSDRAILGALQKKMDEGVDLTVYYDSTGSPNIRKVLKGKGIHPIHQSGIMHQKILVVDERLIFVGSANFTPQSLKMHDNLMLGFHSPTVAKFLKESAPFKSGHLRTWVGGQEMELWLLPDTKGDALKALSKEIRTATKTVRVALFTLTHPTLVDALISAHKRGVRVTLLIDLHSSLGASANAVLALKKANVPVICSKGVALLHHKFAYIDGKVLITGSANWTKAAFGKNSDLMLILRSLNKEQKKEMNRLWKRLSLTGEQMNLS